MNGIHLGIMLHHNKWSLVVADNDMTPLQLTMFLKKYSHKEETQLATMNHVATILLESTTKPLLKNEPCKIHASLVPTSVLQSWNTMLLNSHFWDLTFACPDGKTFRAHKCILSAASDYFANYFAGPWSRHHSDEVWETSNSSDVMWAVLTFVYTGELPAATANAHATELLCVAHEYQLPQLYSIAEASCIRILCGDNVKTMLQLAHLHNSQELEEACFDFVRANAAQMLTQPDFVQLATQNVVLWNKLTKALSSKGMK